MSKPKMQAVFAGALIFFGLSTLDVHAAEGKPMAPPALLASNCFSCHGFEGNSAGIMEPITGMSAEKFTKTVLAFKTGDKPSTVMQRIAKGYKDAEIAAMGRFLATVKTK